MSSPTRFPVKPLVLALALAAAGPAGAYQIKMENGLTINVDTTLSYGAAFRASKRKADLVGIANGGTSRSVNEDDGNLNYDRGEAFTNAVKANMDLEIKYGRWGFFGRGLAFYDFENVDSDKLGPIGRDRLGKDAIGLDGFISGTFEPFGRKLVVRAGKQVISWGESTFIPNGINIVNPVDLSKLRIPGSEIKEAFIPTQGVWANLELTQGLSMEGFVLTNWDKVKLDPKGSYFSTNDAASDDADRVIVGFGRRQDQRFPIGNPVPPVPGLGAAAAALYGPFNPAASIWAPRAADKDASDSGQWGVAFRYLASELNNTEFGLYYVNYHSRVPYFTGVKGTTTSVVTGGPLLSTICGVPALRALCATGTARYYVEYPEDIKMLGLSFNTAGPGGVALQGEYSYRSNLPVQIATTELILASLGLPNLLTGFTQIPGAPAGATSAALVPDGTTISGNVRAKASQFQMTATKGFPNVIGADQLVLVGEVGANWFHNLPPNLRFNGPATYLPATALASAVSGAFSIQDQSGYLTEFSWGYRTAARLEYSNLFAGGNVAPRLAFSHDVRGIGPNFNHGVKSLSGGVTWDYQRKWLVDLQYTSFFGGRAPFCGTDVPTPGGAITPGQSASFCSNRNPLADRDFYSFSVSYSF